jgi:16S rRNA (cytidine1402-2'-O)-methyltransferase
MTAGRLLLGATPLGQPSDASRRLVDALVVSDAGMPLISDPGYRLVVACVDAGLPVTCLPGPSAVTTALAVSGLPSEKFCFEGFAPRKAQARRTWLGSLADERRTCVFFESPRRLAGCLTDAVEILGGARRAVVCRELTKVHEDVVRGSLDELAAWSADGVLGEITVVLAGAIPRADLPSLVSEVQALVAGGVRVKDACGEVAEAHPGVRSRQLYDAVLKSRRETGKSGAPQGA